VVKFELSCWEFGQIDSLAYTYYANTNKIKTITDASGSAKGFKPGIGGDYLYDVNGNMMTDPHKGMTVEYNHLNLPKKMTFTSTSFGPSTNTIEILYDAAGTKLRKTVKTGTTTNYTQDYLGGIEYRDGTRESIYHAEGRLFNNAGTNRYEYSIRDHLGNTRLTFTDKNGNGVIAVSSTPATNEVLQENHYYPFGLNTEGPWMNDAAIDNKYQYNGKEWNDDFGLGWNDYGARWYDATSNRWLSPDPLAAEYTSWSPYNFRLWTLFRSS
jgi:RHS repeat-associated protein